MEEKVFVVTNESCIDGEMFFNVEVCATPDKAKEVFESKKAEVLSQGHFSFKDDENFTIEEEENSYFINDESDDYYELIEIYEKKVRK